MTGISAIIVALGLAMNNTAVIIGGMLIAPIFWPIVGIALSITRGSVSNFRKSVLVLFKALAVAVVLVLIFTLIYPLKDEPGIEVLMRSTPQLFDLIIALFAGFAGAFVIIWPGISSSLAGILTATTLMPAIGVIGYGISTLEINIALGALILFFTNLIAIVFSAIIVFFIFGFHPVSTPRAKEFITKEFIWTTILLLLITIPLSYSLYTAVIENQYKKNIENILLEYIPNLKDSDIESIEINTEKNCVDINAKLQTQRKLNVFEVRQIARYMEMFIGKSVKLDLKIIPVNEVRSE